MELTVAPINKLCSLFGGKNLPRVNLSPSKRMTLDFSATFSNATLTELVKYANQIIQLSKEAINAFSSFPQGMTLSDYIHFKQDRLLFAFGKKEWLEGEEKRLHECVTQLKKCKEAKEKTKENIENIISLTKKQTEKLKEKKKKLLADSQSEQKNSSDFLRGQRKAYKRANKDFLSLEQERGRLVELFRKQSALLNVAVSQNNCEANEVDVRKNAAEIEKGQQNVANDKQAVTASIKSTLERFDASLFAQWYGKLLYNLQKELNELSVRCQLAAEEQMTPPVSLGESQKIFEETLEKEKKEALARKQELEKFPELQEHASRYHQALKAINTSIDRIEELRRDLDYSKDYDIPDDVTKDTSWQRLQKIQDSLGVSLIKVEAHRDELEREIKEISCELDKQASALNGLPFNKNGANYKEMDVKLKKTQKRFMQSDIKETLPMGCNLAKQMQEKHKELGEWIDENKLQMIDKLIAILQDIFSKNNLQKFWRKQVSIAGKIRFFSQDKKSSDLTQGIAVPSGVRDICTALSQLTEEKEPQNKKEKVLKDICLKAKARLENRKVYGRAEPTMRLYVLIRDFLEEDQLNITTDQLKVLNTTLGDKSLFKGLALFSHLSRQTSPRPTFL